MNIQCSIISPSQGSGLTQITRSRWCVLLYPCRRCTLYFPNLPFQMGFSSHYYWVAIGNSTDSLQHCSFRIVHHIALSIPGVSLSGLAFFVCRMSMTDRCTPHIQGELEMWLPTIQAVIGMFYVLSHFYNMYVVTYPLF